jgi:periplasmic divalent cation tolerance protein
MKGDVPTALVIFVTVPDETEAEKIAMRLVEERLAAGISIVTKIKSIYIWEEKLHKKDEILLIIKTNEKLFDKVKNTVQKLHSYIVPEIIALPITKGLGEYLYWIDEVTGQ